MKRTASRVFVAVGCLSAFALTVPLVLYAWRDLPEPDFTPSLLIVDEVTPVDTNAGALAAAENERGYAWMYKGFARRPRN
jgi:hypothetical protein